MAISCDPSDLANAARCFWECIPDQRAVRSYLLCQYITKCNAPQAPTNLVASNLSTTQFQLTWAEPLGIPPVTTTSFTIKWGTSSGNYNLGMADVNGSTFTYSITGLTAQTTYYVVVIANASACPSPASAELSVTTSQSLSALNNNLLGYWALNDGSPALGNGAHDYSPNGFNMTATNTGILSAAGVGNISPVADFHANAGGDNVRGLFSAAAGLNMVANQQFTACAWVKLSNTTASNPVFDNWGTSGFYIGQSGGNLWTFGVHDGANASQFVNGAATSTGAWIFLAGGWDGANIWLQVNAGARATAAVATTHAFTDLLDIGRYAGNGGASIPTDGFIGGCGLWLRTLSTTEVSQVYNAGIGIAPPPFS